MKKFLILPLLLLYLCAFAADDIKIPSTITEVNVYRQRAQIHQEGTAQVKAGDNIVVFSGLSQYILPNSVSVKGEGKGVIQSVKHRINYLNQTEKPARMRAIEDSIKTMQRELQILADELFVYNEEEKMVLKNSQLGSQHEAFSAENVYEMAEFYRSRLREIRNLRRAMLQQQTEKTADIQRFQQEIANMNAQRAQPTQEVVVAFKGDAAGSVKLFLTYLVDNVSWEPFYDLRVANTASPINVALKATVINNTGIDWNRVKLSLSTANNDGSNNPPVMSPQYVNILQTYDYEQDEAESNRAYRKADSRAYAAPAAPVANSMDAYGVAKAEMPSQLASDFTTVQEKTLALNFDISIPYDIPADGKGTQVDIHNMDIKSDFRYYALPKFSCETYLVAYIKQDLLRGRGNVYFEGTFVGETYINTDNPQDSMKLALGRDPRVQVSRRQLEDFTKRRTIGSNTSQTFGYEISLRNTKKEPVTLVLEDQIPVSQNADVKVEVMEQGGATLDAQSGKLTWSITLQPGEKKAVSFKYEVKYPKDANVSNL